LVDALQCSGVAVQRATTVPHGATSLVVALAHVAVGADLPASARECFAMDVSALIEPVFEGLRGGIEAMRETGGAIVTLLMAAAGRPDNDLLFEAVGGAMANLTRSAALHAGKSGYRIRINTLRVGRDDATAMASVADAIAFLGSDAAGFVTGIEIDFDRVVPHVR
jgi:hypothetical protein